LEINFTNEGNLENDLTLQFGEFVEFFGYNSEREIKIINLVTIANKLKQIGCRVMYIFGSFATIKEFPNDIDVCFDVSNIEEEIVERNYANLFDKYELARFRKYLSVHVIYKTSEDSDIIEWLKRNKEGKSRGIIKIFLNKVISYDKE